MLEEKDKLKPGQIQRKSPRAGVLKDGKLIFGQGHSIVDCTIDNVSDGGAHVRVTTHGVPEEFYLVETTKQVIIHRRRRRPGASNQQAWALRLLVPVGRPGGPARSLPAANFRRG
jgi:hypothetical protein